MRSARGLLAMLVVSLAACTTTPQQPQSLPSSAVQGWKYLEPPEQDAVIAIAAQSSNSAAQALAGAKYRPLRMYKVAGTETDSIGQVTFARCEPNQDAVRCINNPTVTWPTIDMKYRRVSNDLRFEGMPGPFVAKGTGVTHFCDPIGTFELNHHTMLEVPKVFSTFGTGRRSGDVFVDFTGDDHFAAQPKVKWHCELSIWGPWSPSPTAV